MKSDDTIPMLKLPRRAGAASNEPWPDPSSPGERGLAGEFERLREVEANLRAYEDRLRTWQQQLEQGPAVEVAPRAGSRGPFVNDVALQEAWQKLYRARELLDAEQRHLRDERIAAQGLGLEIQRREAAVTHREQAVAERERLLAADRAALSMVATEAAPPPTLSRLRQFTRTPFAFARAVFSAGR